MSASDVSRPVGARLATAALLASLALMTGPAPGAGRAVAPEDVVRQYVGAVYARDHGAAYDLVALEHQAQKGLVITKEIPLRSTAAGTSWAQLPAPSPSSC